MQILKNSQVSNTVQEVVRDFGQLDVMIANAGIPSKAGGLDDRLEDWHRVVNIDYNGAYYCARVAGEIFRKQGSGNLIFTASMSGHAANVPQQQVSKPNECKQTTRARLITRKGVLQCVQSRGDPSGEVASCRMGGLCKGKLCQSWLYRHTYIRRLSI